MFILATICTWLAWVSMALAAPGPGGSAGFEGAPGFEGSWKAKVPGPSGQSGMPVTFTFTIKDGRTDGTVSTDERSFALVDVKIDGSTITFAVEGEEQNKYSGTLSGDEIRMQVKYPSHENGTRVWSFVAKKAEGRSEKAEEKTAESAGPSVDGEWEGEVPRGSGRTIEARFTLHADGEVLTGSAQAVGDVFPIEKGKIAGTSIAFRIAGTQGDYTGTVDADEIQMKVKYDGGESGRQTLPFVLRRVRD
jgi:hypothetical protein